MIVLGVETSCDETAAAVCSDGKILSSVISSQGVHGDFGGVIPEIASREHERWIVPVVQSALVRAEVQKGQLDAVAATRGPGLMGALLTGFSFSRGLAQGLEIPFLGINHIEAHIYSNFIIYPELKYPFICLLISGGHTQVWLVRDFGKYELLGETRDDAAGEAFDKGARLLGLGFPGGPAIQKAAEGGDPDWVKFPRALEFSDEVEFSFSGLKTALLYYVSGKDESYIKNNLSHISASYQKAIVEILLKKLQQAVHKAGINSVVIAGGVAANQELRKQASILLKNCTVLYPPISLCTDNAAMIAFLAEQYLHRGIVPTSDSTVIPNLKLTA